MACLRLPIVLLLACCLFLLSGCDAPYGPDEFKTRGCRRCHVVSIDKTHDIGCVKCHHGDPDARDVATAHAGLVKSPADPVHMAETCGRCHARRVQNAAASSHFTLKDEIGEVWRAFFPKSTSPPLPQDLRKEEYPWSLQGLVADMLRKRCLRCHVWYGGDDYSGTRRGKGCAACHLKSASLQVPLDHRFRRQVDDSACLSCHYGNFVGWDYYGRFEKDYPADFRAPLIRGLHEPRPYGVEWLDMTPDVHRQKGMTCRSCHSQAPCDEPADSKRPACLSCHPAGSLPASSPGHSLDGIRLVSCTVCHAVWAPVETGRYLMRVDSPDYDQWLPLSVQGSSEVEQVCRDEVTLPFDTWQEPLVQDKIDGSLMPGMWFEGFVARRFWPVVIAETTDHRLVNVRPLLDLSISYVNSQDMVMADNIRPETGQGQCPDGRECIQRICPEFLPGKSFIAFLEPGLFHRPWLWLAYTPHTVGHADMFRTSVVAQWLKSHGKTER